ncbi:anti-sigma-I factor RsgI family protein [Butyrivibrio sp. NC2002]|uniref:anti-sigma-I factor RsgI family protein n=1 Tax=Butyrivibrio sp. NC2002 TaxID=1410610 RepID=UPI0005693A64|nr:hypothetical protein [Butyrivibrio sp. NC2002]
MKATVLDSNGRVSYVLCDDGIFRQLKGVYEKGCTLSVDAGPFNSCIIHTNAKRGRILRFAAPIVAAASMMLCAITGNEIAEDRKDCSYVTIDVNPSIEYALNRKDKVISVNALNDDAVPIVEELRKQKVESRSDISYAIEKTITILKDSDYLADDERSVLIDVANDDEDSSLQIKDSVTAVINDKDPDINLCILESSMDERKIANDKGMSVGRYAALVKDVNKSEKNDTDVIEYSSLPVKTIVKNITEPVEEIVEPAKPDTIASVQTKADETSAYKEKDESAYTRMTSEVAKTSSKKEQKSSSDKAEVKEEQIRKEESVPVESTPAAPQVVVTPTQEVQPPANDTTDNQQASPEPEQNSKDNEKKQSETKDTDEAASVDITPQTPEPQPEPEPAPPQDETPEPEPTPAEPEPSEGTGDADVIEPDSGVGEADVVPDIPEESAPAPEPEPSPVPSDNSAEVISVPVTIDEISVENIGE